MAKKNLILLSMEDSKIKKIANVISNDSCRKILDYLANKEATESELAEKLSIPISTVHYNLQQLMESGLVDVEEFHYSAKGREVDHYKLANKYIIIAPKKTKTAGLKQKLKSILPVALIAAGTAGIIQLLSSSKISFPSQSMAAKAGIAERAFDASPAMAGEALETASAGTEAAVEAAPAAAQQAADIATSAPVLLQNPALWFLIGALFALAVYFIWGMIRKKG